MSDTFKGINLDTLPKRTRGPKVDIAAAKALHAIVMKDGAASDFNKYDTAEKARAAGLRATRMLAHVTPDGKRAALRTFAVEGGKFGFAVFYKDAADDEAGEQEAAE